MNPIKGFFQAFERSPSHRRLADTNRVDAQVCQPDAVQLLARAHQNAARLHHNFVGTEHLLLGLLEVDQSAGLSILISLGLEPAKVLSEIKKQVGEGPEGWVATPLPYTPRSKKVFALAAKAARAHEADKIGTEHILLGLVEEVDGVAARVLRVLGIQPDQVAERIRVLLATAPSTPPDRGSFEALDFAKRYDLHCLEGTATRVYENVFFKGLACLASEGAAPLPKPGFLVIELDTKQLVYIALSSISKFHEHTKESGV